MPVGAERMTGSSLPSARRIQPGRATGGEVIRTLIRILALGVLGLGLWPPAQAAAQNDSGDDVRFHLRTAVELVVVPVTAKDRRGQLVTDLAREEFRLWENGAEQPIRYFSIDPFPLSAVILVDAGLSPAAHEAVQATLAVLPSVFAPADEFALFVFDTYPRQRLEFTRDPETLRVALDRLREEAVAVPSGASGGPMTAGPRINQTPVGPGVPSTLPKATKSVKSIHDALYAAGLALRGREPGRRRVVFIVSDGLNSRLNTHSFDETRDLLLEAEVSVYALGVDNARFAVGGTVLTDYARSTGGDAYAPMKQDDLTRAWLQVGEQARNQYTLVYAAPPAPGGREYRRIQVRVGRPGVELRARDGYFAGLPLH